MDRNPENPMIRIDKVPSLSARRAWIEIDVDSASGTLSDSRSPQGERG